MEMYIPETEQSLAELKTLTNLVHDFLLEATDHVLPYFHRRGLAVDRTVSSDMFRFELSRQLKGNCQVTDQNYQDLTVKKLSNNGIECRFAGWAIKIFRGTELHPPGYSNSRLSFFRQERSFNYSMIPGPVSGRSYTNQAKHRHPLGILRKLHHPEPAARTSMLRPHPLEPGGVLLDG